MRQILFIALLILTLFLNSCSISYWVYIRNLTNNTATIDVYLNDINDFEILPTNLKTANQIVRFKKGHKQAFTDTTQIVWLDSLHGRIEVRPNSTVDLENITYFFNSFPTANIKILVTTQKLIDTLMTSRTDIRRKKFKYNQNGFILPRPISYYDIKE